jgi:hypothetical protein
MSTFFYLGVILASYFVLYINASLAFCTLLFSYERNLTTLQRLKDERRRQRWNAEEFENEMMQAAYLAEEQRYDEAISTYNDAEICLPENNKEYNVSTCCGSQYIDKLLT